MVIGGRLIGARVMGGRLIGGRVIGGRLIAGSRDRRHGDRRHRDRGAARVSLSEEVHRRGPWSGRSRSSCRPSCRGSSSWRPCCLASWPWACRRLLRAANLLPVWTARPDLLRSSWEPRLCRSLRHAAERWIAQRRRWLPVGAGGRTRAGSEYTLVTGPEAEARSGRSCCPPASTLRARQPSVRRSTAERATTTDPSPCVDRRSRSAGTP